MNRKKRHYCFLNQFLTAVLFAFGLLSQAQAQNNAAFYIGDNGFVFLSPGNYNFDSNTANVQTSRTPTVNGKLVFSAGATCSGVSDTHFVDGYVQSMSESAFLFPIGQSAVYAPLKTIATTTNGVTAAYFRSNPSAIGSTLDAAVGGLSTVEYWDIQGASTSARLSLSWRASSGIAVLTQSEETTISVLTNLTVLGYDGAKWVVVPSTVDAVSLLGSPSTFSTGSITTDASVALGNYSAFALGSLNSKCTITITWDGTSWSPIAPVGAQALVISGDYIATANLAACSLTITNNAQVVVSSGINFTIAGAVAVTAGASLTLENNSNLIQSGAINANTGNIIVKRDTNALMRLDYTLWSAPVAFQQLQSFSPLTLSSRFYTYNGANNFFNPITVPATTDFETGSSYLIRSPNNHPDFIPTIWTGTFQGVPNNGDYNITVVGNTYNAIGNPYPSSMDADAFINNNAISEALYFWRKTNNSDNSSYATYTLAGGISNSGGLSNIEPNGIIQVGQGFIAKSSSTTISIKNTMRKMDNNNQFFRTTTAVAKHRIWLSLSSPTAPTNQMLVAYMAGATNELDSKIDGRYFNDNPTALNSFINDGEYAIQGRALPFMDTDVVPLTFKSASASNFTIAIDHVDGLFLGNQNIFLKDNLTGTTHDLKQSGYSFATAIGTYNNRFELVYQNSALSTSAFHSDAVTVFMSSANLFVKSKLGITTIEVYDSTGRKVQSYDAKGAMDFTNPFYYARGIYLVKLKLSDGTIAVQKTIN